MLPHVKQQSDDTWRTQRKQRWPEVDRIEEFNLGIFSGGGFVDEDPCEKEEGKKSHICLVSETQPCASAERQSWPSKGNETDRKDNKEDRLSRRRKPSFGVSFVEHQ